jgi:GTP-binding protein
VPGLIPGAATGKGLGLQFLRHIERCSVLAHVVDTATLEPGRDPVADIDALEAELAAYGGLEDKPRVIVLNKIDVPDGRDLADIVEPDLAKYGWPVYRASAATREGLQELIYALARLVDEHRAAQPVLEPTRLVLRPSAVDDSGFTVERDSDDVWLVKGSKPERWVRQTNFDNDEAVGYLADRLARLGVEEKLARLGAQPGDPVRIGAMEFDWQPTIEAEFIPTSRGADVRLEDTDSRLSAAERLALRKERRVRPEGDTAGDWAEEE